MKKILITILIFLFAATAISYAGIFRQTENESTGSNGSTYENTAVSPAKESTDDYGGFFRAPDNPGSRPDSGGGIGQKSPSGDGVYVLIACCVFLAVVKHSQQKSRKVSGQLG